MYQIKKLLGNKIKYLRNKRGITQEYFAEQLGISPRSVSFIETGKNYPSPETLSNICEVLGTEPYKLFMYPREKEYSEIKDILIEKINDDMDFTMLLYDYARLLV